MIWQTYRNRGIELRLVAARVRIPAAGVELKSKREAGRPAPGGGANATMCNPLITNHSTAML